MTVMEQTKSREARVGEIFDECQQRAEAEQLTIFPGARQAISELLENDFQSIDQIYRNVKAWQNGQKQDIVEAIKADLADCEENPRNLSYPQGSIGSKTAEALSTLIGKSWNRCAIAVLHFRELPLDNPEATLQALLDLQQCSEAQRRAQATKDATFQAMRAADDPSVSGYNGSMPLAPGKDWTYYKTTLTSNPH